VAPTSIDTPLPRSRPATPAADSSRSLQSKPTAAVNREAPAAPVHPLVQAAERMNPFGNAWWFAGLLVAVFAAAVGRSLCG
jgi:hypothetical protein